jgi:hypothetical protein
MVQKRGEEIRHEIAVAAFKAATDSKTNRFMIALFILLSTTGEKFTARRGASAAGRQTQLPDRLGRRISDRQIIKIGKGHGRLYRIRVAAACP